MPDNPILITHIDFDGVTCAILFKAVWPEGIVFYEDYKTVDQRIKTVLAATSIETPIYITDIAPPGHEASNIAVAIQKRVHDDHAKVMLFDHHETAKWLNRYGWAHVNSNYCGAKLFHMFLTEQHAYELDAYADLVFNADTYDRWQTESPAFEHASKINRLLYILGRERFIDRFLGNFFALITAQEFTLLELDAEKQERYIAEAINNAYLLESRNGAQYALCFAEEYPSQIGHALLEKFGALSFVAIVNLKDMKVSLRSHEGEYDVSGLAKEYGGGGHQAAAGFQLGKECIRAINGSILFKHVIHTAQTCGNCGALEDYACKDKDCQPLVMSGWVPREAVVTP